jgi:hypothetical protein
VPYPVVSSEPDEASLSASLLLHWTFSVKFAVQPVSWFALLKSPFGNKSCATTGGATSAPRSANARNKRLSDCIDLLPCS